MMGARGMGGGEAMGAMGGWRMRLALLGALLGLVSSSALAACAPRHEIAFADGSRTCLADHPMGALQPLGQLASLSRTAPVHGLYHMALPRNPAMCPAAIGYVAAVSTGGLANAAIQSVSSASQRAERAVASCQSAAGASKAGSPCECIVVIADGQSTLPRQEFDRLARDAAAPQSVAFVANAPIAPGQPAAAAPAAAQPQAACAPRHAVGFADASRGCLADLPTSTVQPSAQLASVFRSIPVHGLYHLALPRNPAMCPAAIGYVAAVSTGGLANAAIQGVSSVAQRAERAVASCQSAAGASKAGSPCECIVVLADGQSALPRPEFERLVRDAAAPQSVALDVNAPTPPGQPAAAALAAVQALACPPYQALMFADGKQACMADFSIAALRPAGQSSPLIQLLPNSGAYHLALPRSPAGCPAATGFAWSMSRPWQQASGGDTAEQRAERALRACDAAVRAAAGGAECGCQIVVEDGHSRLSLAQFAQLTKGMGPPSVAAAPAPRAAPAAPGAPTPSAASTTNTTTTASTASAAPTTVPAPAGQASRATVAAVPPPTVAPSGAPAATAPAAMPSAADIAALRQQIEALQTQMARQSAATAAAAAAPAAQARGGGPKLRTRVLVIGNSAYRNLGALANPTRDAQAMADKFRKFGLEVDLVLDTDRAALVNALTDYQTRAAGYDVNILFYAGHGLQVGGINYLVPVDMAAAGATVGSVKLNAVSLNDALEYLPARTRVVFLDACRDNPLARSLLAARTSAGVGLAPVNTTSGTLVAYATKDGSTAEDGSGRNSPYTTALLQHLDAEEDIAVVLRRVRQEVLKATSARQEPWEYGSLIGEQLVLSHLGR